MRGDDGDLSLEVETSRAAYELRKPDAPRRTAEALARARRLNDVEQARELAGVRIDNQHRRLDPDDLGPSRETLVKHRRRRGDTIEALIRTGALEWHQQASALQVAAVYECLTGTCGRAVAAGNRAGWIAAAAAAAFPSGSPSSITPGTCLG